jgi:hypothetical protein
MGTLTLEQSGLRMHICICLILYESCGLATPGPPGRLPTENYAVVAASSPGLRRASFHCVVGFLYHSSTTEPLSLLILRNGSYPGLGASLRCGEVIVSLVAAVASLIHATRHAGRYLPIKGMTIQVSAETPLHVPHNNCSVI